MWTHGRPPRLRTTRAALSPGPGSTTGCPKGPRSRPPRALRRASWHSICSRVWSGGLARLLALTRSLVGCRAVHQTEAAAPSVPHAGQRAELFLDSNVRDRPQALTLFQVRAWMNPCSVSVATAPAAVCRSMIRSSCEMWIFSVDRVLDPFNRPSARPGSAATARRPGSGTSGPAQGLGTLNKGSRPLLPCAEVPDPFSLPLPLNSSPRRHSTHGALRETPRRRPLGSSSSPL